MEVSVIPQFLVIPRSSFLGKGEGCCPLSIYLLCSGCIRHWGIGAICRRIYLEYFIKTYSFLVFWVFLCYSSSFLRKLFLVWWSCWLLIIFVTGSCVTLGDYYYYSGGARGVMVTVLGNGHGDTSFKSLDETNCISHRTNTLGKGMNPIILPPAMDK